MNSLHGLNNASMRDNYVSPQNCKLPTQKKKKKKKGNRTHATFTSIHLALFGDWETSVRTKKVTRHKI